MSEVSVSDVFAFAAANAEFWDLLSPAAKGELPELETEDQREAFEAARAHVQKSYETLLRECANAFRLRAPEKDEKYQQLKFPKQSRSKTVLQDQTIVMPLKCPPGRVARLQVSVEKDSERGCIRLYAALRSSSDETIAYLRAAKLALQPDIGPPAIQEARDGFYFGHLALTKDARFDDLASKLVDLAWPLVQAYVEWPSNPEPPI